MCGENGILHLLKQITSPEDWRIPVRVDIHPVLEPDLNKDYTGT